MAKKRAGGGARKTAKPLAEARAHHAPDRARGDGADAAPPDPFSLSGAFVERALLTGERRDLLEQYLGEQAYHELQSLARHAQRSVACSHILLGRDQRVRSWWLVLSS